MASKEKYNITIRENNEKPIPERKFKRIIANALHHGVLVYDRDTGQIAREVDGIKLPSVKEVVYEVTQRHIREKQADAV